MKATTSLAFCTALWVSCIVAVTTSTTSIPPSTTTTAPSTTRTSTVGTTTTTTTTTTITTTITTTTTTTGQAIILPLTASNAYNTSISVEISVGTPEKLIDVVVDTGSPLLFSWKNGTSADIGCMSPAPYFPSESSTWKATGTVNFAFDGSSIAGEIGEDVVSIGGATATVPYAVVEEFGGTCIAGLLGCDMDSNSLPTILQQSDHGNMFGLCVPSPSAAGKVMSLGGVVDEFHVGGFECVDTVPVASRVYATQVQGGPNVTKWWQVSVSRLQVNGFNIYLATKTQALVDSGTGLTLVSTTLAQNIYARISVSGLTFNSTCWMGTITSCPTYLEYKDNLNVLATISITISQGTTLTFPPDTYVVEVEGMAVPAFRGVADIPENFIVFGLAPMFWRHYILFDYDNAQVGFAARKDVVGSVPLENTCAATGATTTAVPTATTPAKTTTPGATTMASTTATTTPTTTTTMTNTTPDDKRKKKDEDKSSSGLNHQDKIAIGVGCVCLAIIITLVILCIRGPPSKRKASKGLKREMKSRRDSRPRSRSRVDPLDVLEANVTPVTSIDPMRERLLYATDDQYEL